MTRHTPLNRKTPLRSASKKRAKQLREYSRVRKEFLKTWFFCEVCRADRKSQRADDIHHTHGRNGERLLDVNFWLPVCREHHDFIHSNPKWAREQGYLV